MVFDISVAMTWILFIALFPISFIWYRRAWRILIQNDISEVALKGGVAPKDPKKFAPYVALLNIIAAALLTSSIFGVITGKMEYETWSAIAGSTIWMKIIFDFIIRRHAHMEPFGRKKQDKK
jgi:hypothetical protein